MSVCCECCVLSGRGLCDELITCPEESYRVWGVWVWSWSFDNEEALAHWGLSSHKKKIWSLKIFKLILIKEGLEVKTTYMMTVTSEGLL
jgi:hypothetical protein